MTIPVQTALMLSEFPSNMQSGSSLVVSSFPFYCWLMRLIRVEPSLGVETLVMLIREYDKRREIEIEREVKEMEGVEEQGGVL